MALALKWFIGLLGLLLICACGKGADEAENGRSVVIGVIAPFETGDVVKGKRGYSGIAAALSQHPELADGSVIELQLQHSDYGRESALAAFERLAENDRVMAVVSFLNSDASLALAPAADERGLPLLVATATNPDIVTDRSFVNQLIFDDKFQGAVAALYTRDELLIDRVAVLFDPGNTYSSYLSEEFARKFKDVGGRITAVVPHNWGAYDYEAALESVRRDKPQLLYIALHADAVVEFAEELAAMQWAPRVMVPDGVLSVLAYDHTDKLKYLEGFIGTDVFSPNVPLLRLAKRYSLINAAQPGKSADLDTYSVLGIESMLVLRDAMDRCLEPGLTRRCVGERIRETRNLAGVIGPIDITAEGRAVRPLVVNAIEGGEIAYRVRVH